MVGIHEKIKQVRIEKNITIEEMSIQTGLSITTLKKIEDGNFEEFLGDEQYVRMFLKRICKILDLPVEEILDDYSDLTQELHLSKREIDAKMNHYKKQNNNNKPLVRSTSVYEDNHLIRYFKYFLAIILIVGIIVALWFSVLSFLESENATSNPPSVGQVDKNPDLEEKDKEEDKEQVNIPNPLTITNIADSSFDILGIKVGETVNVEVTFKKATAFNLWGPNGQIPGAYKASYQPDEVYQYQFQANELTSLTVNIWDFENHIIKVNGQVVEVNPATLKVIDGVVYITLNIYGEQVG